MNTFSHVPPGFRFHPTDEELVDYYLRKKIGSKKIDLDVIKDVDLYKIEPWDLQELCRIGSDEENEWYFFSHKDKKYPTGTRTNRATKAGFWKATGRDKAIYTRHTLVGMRKTLVFYKGRAPNGQKSDWIMHEYRLETNENAAPQEEGWVVCRVFKKRLTAVRKASDCYDSPCNWPYDDQVSSFMQEQLESPSRPPRYFHLPCKQELELQYSAAAGFSQVHMQLDPFLQLPQLESPKLQMIMPAAVPYSCPQADRSISNNNNNIYNQHMNIIIANQDHQNNSDINGVDQVTTDWRVLDKFVASQLSHDEDHSSSTPPAAHAPNNSKEHNIMSAQQLAFPDDQQMKVNSSSSNQDRYGSTSTSIDLWK